MTDASGESVSVILRVPRSAQEGQLCEWEISGNCGSSREEVSGDDAIGALGIALLQLPDGIDELNSQLHFEEGPPGATGFERYHSDPDMDALVRHMLEAAAYSNILLYQAMDACKFRDDEMMSLSSELAGAARLRQKIQSRVIGLAQEQCDCSPLFQERTELKIQRYRESSIAVGPIGTTTRVRRDTGASVVIALWSPRRDKQDSKTPWVCDYKISGLDDLVHAGTRGVDSMDSLQCAFWAIGSDLESSGLHLDFPDSEAGLGDRLTPVDVILDKDLGFTGFERYGQGPEFSSFVQHLIACETLQNRLLYNDLCRNSIANVETLEEKLFHHVRAMERIRLKARRREIAHQKILHDTR